MGKTSLPPAVTLSHVHFVLNGQEVLCDIDAVIERKEYVGIVGPNGGGKTTLLRMILGLIEPNFGSVKLLGTDPLSARKQGRIGYVPQRVVQSDFAFPATAEEIVLSGRTTLTGIGRMFSKNDRSIAEHALETAGVSDLRKRLIGNLSGGERQKVFIARALASQPEILILDEPTTGVDAASQEEFYALLRKLHQQHGLTILFVSHDIDVMSKEASRILCLNRTLAANCSAHEFLHSKEHAQLYGDGMQHIHHSHRS